MSPIDRELIDSTEIAFGATLQRVINPAGVPYSEIVIGKVAIWSCPTEDEANMLAMWDQYGFDIVRRDKKHNMDRGLPDLIDELREYGIARKGELAGMVLEAANRLEELAEAHDQMAVVPCGDAISRQAVLDSVGADWKYEGLESDIENLPSVNPQEPKTGHWIPVSERLPEEDGQYLITVKYVHVDGYDDIYAEHGEWRDGNWDMFCFGHCGQVETILAWMPLPAPYKPQESEEQT